MKLYGERASTGRAPKERCEKWMRQGHGSGKGRSAEGGQAKCAQKREKTKAIPSFSLSYVDIVAPLLILQRNKKKISAWAASHLDELQERVEFLLQVFASDCGLPLAGQGPSQTTWVPPLTTPRPPASASGYAEVPFQFAKKSLLKSPVLKS